MQSKPLTLQELNNLYKETFFMEDDAVLPLVIAIVVGARLNAPAVWLYLVGPSSGGKTALLSAFSKVPFSYQISDMTANTFLSGMGGSGEREPSLLTKLGNNFVIIMKDFTTIMSKSPETQEAIVAQMREIYDGHIRKDTGVGKVLEWGTKDKPNKATFIMASTEAIYKVQEKFADMGTRAVNYVMLPQDRKKTARVALRKNSRLQKELSVIQDKVAEFIMDKINNVPDELPDIDDELREEIIDVSDFAAFCRSVVLRDYRGAKNLALTAELPMRMAKQLMSAAQFMMYCNDGVLTPQYRASVFKLALDSIPKQRRLILEVLAKYNKSTVVGVAQKINYPSDFTREWIEDLNMFDVVYRKVIGHKEYWMLKEEYRKLMNKYLGVKLSEENLEEDGIIGSSEEVDISWEQQDQKKQDDVTFGFN